MSGLSAWIGRWRTWTDQPHIRKRLIAFGVILFVVTLAVAATNFPARPNALRFGPLVLALVVFAPVSMLLSAVEYALTGRIVGQHVGTADAIRISVISSLGNLLPVPGSFLVRAGHLAGRGVPPTHAATAPSVLALAWVGVGALAAGSMLAVRTERSAWGAAFMIGGLLGLLGSALLLSRLVGRDAGRWMLPILLVEGSAVAVSAIRYYLVLSSLGFDPTAEAAGVLAFSSVLGVAAGVVPGGLGVREVLAGAFVLLTGLDASVGALAAAVNRIIGLLALGAVGALVLATSRPAEFEERAPPEGRL